jgi:hypothetical protein
MSVAPNYWWISAICFTVWLLLLILWVRLQGTDRSLLSLAALSVPLFVTWKHSIVRQDGPHITHLIAFGMFVMALLLAEALKSRSWHTTLPMIGLLLIPLIAPWFSVEWHEEETHCAAVSSLMGRLARPFRMCGLRDLAELTHFAAYRNDIARESEASLRRDVLSESIRSMINESKVDVYPWEVSYVAANGLLWANRPIPASFSAYTPRLDRLNAAFLASQGRPEYLLWHPYSHSRLLSIDNRHIFWDEPRTLGVIMNFYQMVGGDASVLLLRARTSPRFDPPRPLGMTTVTWNTWLSVPNTAGILLAGVSIRRLTAMKIIRTLFREDPVRLSLRFASGGETTYRIVPDNSEAGLWLSPLPTTLEELRLLCQDGTGRQVVAVRFSAGRLSRLYQPIVVSWSEMTPVAVAGSSSLFRAKPDRR